MSLVEKKLGQRVAFYRRAAGLTQAQLAEKVDVSTEAVSRLERGVAIPSIQSIERIAAALGVELPDMFRFTARETAKLRALDELVQLLRRRSASDIEMLRDLALRIFQRGA